MMKLKNSTRGFTLIELLVVITIIGILATGATSVYTSQIQKARDTTRINDVKALQWGVEQVYQDGGEYPHADTFVAQVSTYMQKLPSDSKHAQPCYSSGTNTSDCGYVYKAEADDNTILYGTYELSTGFENSGNITSKAATDKNGGGNNDSVRYEVGIPKTAGINTTVSKDTITAAVGVTVIGGTAPTNGTDLVIINGQ